MTNFIHLTKASVTKFNCAFLTSFWLLNTCFLPLLFSQSDSLELFSSAEPMSVRLTFDISEWLKSKNDEEENYYPAKMVFHPSPSDSIVKNVHVRTRGFFRKMKCFFPPILLNFKKDTLVTNYGRMTKIKLVTHCNNSSAYNEYVLKEYLAYKLYELVYPCSFKTQLLTIEYDDAGERDRYYVKYGFLIEPLESLTARNNAVEVKAKYFKPGAINELDADRVAFFMYMIGNTDWRIKSGHNVKFIKRLELGLEQATPIPYDFDHAGFINAVYAAPSEWSNVSAVTERDFLGVCRITDANYFQLIEEYLAVESIMYQTIEAFDLLEERDRRWLLNYISRFFDELRNEKTFVRYLHNNCMEDY